MKGGLSLRERKNSRQVGLNESVAWQVNLVRVARNEVGDGEGEHQTSEAIAVPRR